MKTYAIHLFLFLLSMTNVASAIITHNHDEDELPVATEIISQALKKRSVKERHLQSEYAQPVDNIELFDVGYEHNCILFTIGDNNMQCWGSNESGQLGLGDNLPRGDQPNEMGDDLRLTYLGKTKKITKISLGGLHTCTLFDEGMAKCFGDNTYGQLALGDTENRGDQPKEMGDRLPYIDIGEGNKIFNLVTGFMHTCFYVTGSRVSCFGNNRYGQLGVGDTLPRGGSIDDVGDNVVFIDITVKNRELIYSSGTSNHTCILYRNDAKCWGSNSKGQLGYGDTNHRGDEPNEMGNNLPVISFIPSATITKITLGGANTCISKGMLISCFGDNNYGQFALGNTRNIGDQPNEMGKKLRSTAISLYYGGIWPVVGSGFICVFSDSLKMRCFGKNIHGELGQGDTVNRGGTPSTIEKNIPITSLGTFVGVINSVLSGNSHTCALIKMANDATNTVKCFGDGSKGQLGYGDINNRGDDPEEMGDNLPQISLRTIPQYINPP